MAASSRSRLLNRFYAIAGVLTIAGLAGCMPPEAPKPAPPPPAPVQTHARTATHPLSGEQPGFIRLSNTPQGRVPIRVGVLLPLSNGSAATRTLARSMLNAAQMAMFDSRNPDILLMPQDEGSTPREAAAGARTLLNEGAEVIVGPLFAQSALAVAPLARDRGVPVISFSTDRAVAGDGVYLLSFQPEAEVRRAVSYAAAHGHTNFTAIVPQNAYGERVASALKVDAAAYHLTVRAILRFAPSSSDFSQTAKAATASGADTILIAQGGTQLVAIAALLGSPHPQLLGTGLWAQKSLEHETALSGGWFAAPSPRADANFESRYRAIYGAAPPQLAPLAYDAVSLISVLAPGRPYHRFTDAALTDADGFSGATGVFRFRADGSCERGLAILSVEPDGFHVVDPAPKTFQPQAS